MTIVVGCFAISAAFLFLFLVTVLENNRLDHGDRMLNYAASLLFYGKKSESMNLRFICLYMLSDITRR